MKIRISVSNTNSRCKVDQGAREEGAEAYTSYAAQADRPSNDGLRSKWNWYNILRLNQSFWLFAASAVCGFIHFTQPSLSWGRDLGTAARGSLNETPVSLENVGINEKLGDQVDLDLNFLDENGDSVSLQSFFRDGKPVLLSLAYYSCPSLCNLHLNGLKDVFKKLDSPIGQDFHSVVVSIEPSETPELARKKKENYLKSYGRPEGQEGWHFLVGNDSQIKVLADQVGFEYRWDEDQEQWAHAAAAIVLTPDGRISRYLYGIDFQPETLRLSMVEASSGRIGNLVDRLILFCFHFDPKANKYTLYASNIMRAGGAMMVFVMAMFLAPFWIRNRRESGRV